MVAQLAGEAGLARASRAENQTACELVCSEAPLLGIGEFVDPAPEGHHTVGCLQKEARRRVLEGRKWREWGTQKERLLTTELTFPSDPPCALGGLESFVGLHETGDLVESGACGHCPGAGIPAGLSAARHDAADLSSALVQEGRAAHAPDHLTLFELEAAATLLVQVALVGEADRGAAHPARGKSVG